LQAPTYFEAGKPAAAAAAAATAGKKKKKTKRAPPCSCKQAPKNLTSCRRETIYISDDS
jgi:hypothetical protein